MILFLHIWWYSDDDSCIGTVVLPLLCHHQALSFFYGDWDVLWDAGYRMYSDWLAYRYRNHSAHDPSGMP
jgi:hypothetical protein